MTRDTPNTPQRSAKMVSSNQQQFGPPHSLPSHHHAGHTKIAHIEPFCLLSQDDRSLKKAAELIEKASLGRHRVCVVSIISKDSMDESMKNHLVQAVLNGNGGSIGNTSNKRRARSNNNGHNKNGQTTSKITTNASKDETSQDAISTSGDDYENQVAGQVDCKAGIIVLNLTSFLETDKLYSLSSLVEECPVEGDDRPKESLALNSWPLWNQNLIKTMLILLIMSHIVVFYNPEPSIDYNLIQLFKVLEALRLKSQTRITDLLETIASKQMFPQQWIRQGRVSCPRALFVCDTTCLDVKINHAGVLGMKRDLEDQVYRLLKKTNIISRPAGSSHNGIQQTTLLSLPERCDFIFIITRHDLQSCGSSRWQGERSRRMKNEVDRGGEAGDYNSMLVKSLGILNLSSDDPDEEVAAKTDQQAFTSANEEVDSLSQEGVDDSQHQVEAKQMILLARSNTTPHYYRFKKFLFKHISDIQAISQIDQDNKHTTSGKQTTASLLLPRYDDFFTVLLRLKRLFFPESSSSDESSSDNNPPTTNLASWQAPDERRFVDIYDLFNYDELFSKYHCYKTRLAAFDFYTRDVHDLPVSNASQQDSLESARKLYLNHARGPACLANLDLLIDQCNHFCQNMRLSRLSVDGNGRDARPLKGNRVSRTMSSDSTPSAHTSTNFANQATKNRLKSGHLIARCSSGVKMITSCDCGRQSTFLITPTDRKRKLERIDVHRVND